MRVFVRSFSILAFALLVPSVAYAQASIAGVVRDTSGAVLPGVTVEAASPALIEKVRIVVTDGAGQYRVVDLRPGTYTVTFTLPGFNTVKREGILLEGSFSATVNADLRVGALEETITVTGAAPVVDLQSVRQSSVVDREAIRDLPTSRHYAGVAALIPGVTISNNTQNVGGIGIVSPPRYAVHGSRESDGRMQIEGLTTASSCCGGFNGASLAEYVMPVGIAQEMNITTSGGLGEADTAGLIINLVPREGGNTVRGSWFTDFANGAMQGSNFTDELRAAGLATPSELDKVWEVYGVVGGPIRQDKLWYLVGYRHQGSRFSVANLWYNKNANDPTKWLYEPDFDRPATADGTLKNLSGRLTWQATPRNKVGLFWDEPRRKNGWLGGRQGAANRSPEADGMQVMPNTRISQLSWNSPVTNRLLLEAGGGQSTLRVIIKERPGENPDLISVTEQSGIIPGLVYRAQPNYHSLWFGTYPWRAAMSYVTGSHTVKVGYNQVFYWTPGVRYEKNNILYRFNNGVPNQLTLLDDREETKHLNTMGLYAQDSWVVGKLTLQGGLRYDRQWQFFPAQRIGFTRFIPNGFFTEETEGVKWHDITPRLAGAYDLTGDGKTAIRVTLGKFTQAQDGGGLFGFSLNPSARLATTTTRAWNDVNRDYVPDCDLLNRAANGECGAYSNGNFGQNIYSFVYDDDLLHGWGKRPYTWEGSASIQREVITGLGVTVGYFRRWFGNFVVTDNRAVGPGDFNTFSVVAPADSRLPDGGGQTISGLFDVVPAKFGQVDNFVTRASNFGDWTETWHGVDFNVAARNVKGVTMSAGVSTGKRAENFCDLRANFPEIGPLNPYCDWQEPFLTQYKAQGSYTIPGIEVMVSGTLQSNPGPELAANFNVPNATVAPSLGRSLSGNAANVPVNLVERGKLYGERTNQVDLRLAKILSYGRTRSTVGVNLFNAFNAAPITGYNQTFGARYLLPTQTMPARFLKFSFQVDF